VVSPLALAGLAERVHHPPEVYGLALKADPSEIFLDWLPFLWQAGGDVLDESGRPAFAGEAGVRALQAYVDLRRFCPSDTHRYGNAQVAAALREGRVAMATTWGGQAGPLFLGEANFPYRCAVFPKPWNATWGLAIPANQAAETRQQALSLLLLALNLQSDQAVISAAGSPVRKASYAPAFLAKYAWLSAQKAMLEGCGRLPAIPELGRFLGALYPAVYRAFIGEQSPEAALKAAEELVS
jgi:multiple sugar transport system substrate-binding protein